MPETLFKKIGGRAAVNAAVDLFYKKVLEDDRLAPFFEGVQMKKQSSSLKTFLSMAFGSAAKYRGKSLREAHAEMVSNGLGEEHFILVVQHLGATLRELGVSEDLIAEVVEIAASVKEDILAGPQTHEETQASDTDLSLFDSLGGAAAIDTAVEIFYKKVLSDSSLSPFFEEVDMNRQIASQKAFLTMAFGGPANYKGRQLREAHAHLVEKGLNHDHFNSVVAHLGATLIELNVPDHLITKAAQIAESVREDILAGPDKPPGPIAPKGWEIVATCEHCYQYALLRGPDGHIRWMWAHSHDCPNK